MIVDSVDELTEGKKIQVSKGQTIIEPGKKRETKEKAKTTPPINTFHEKDTEAPITKQPKGTGFTTLGGGRHHRQQTKRWSMCGDRQPTRQEKQR